MRGGVTETRPETVTTHPDLNTAANSTSTLYSKSLTKPQSYSKRLRSAKYLVDWSIEGGSPRFFRCLHSTKARLVIYTKACV